MTYRILRNTSQNAVLLVTATNNNIVVLGNSSVSAIGLPSATDDAIVGVSIKQIWFSGDSGAGANGWDIIRNANTVWQTDSTGWQDFAGNGMAISADKTEANVSFTRTGSRGTLMVELQKEYAGGYRPSDSDY